LIKLKKRYYYSVNYIGGKMFFEEFIFETNSPKDRIWSSWIDVNNWNKWDAGIEYSHLNGHFENGTYGSFKTSDGGAKALYLSFEIKNCIHNKSFTGRIKLTLCTIDLGYELIEEDTKLKTKYYIKIYGLLTFVYKRIIENSILVKLPMRIKKIIDSSDIDFK
jgi:hypothetical protein